MFLNACSSSKGSVLISSGDLEDEKIVIITVSVIVFFGTMEIWRLQRTIKINTDLEAQSEKIETIFSTHQSTSTLKLF